MNNCGSGLGRRCAEMRQRGAAQGGRIKGGTNEVVAGRRCDDTTAMRALIAGRRGSGLFVKGTIGSSVRKCVFINYVDVDNTTPKV